MDGTRLGFLPSKSEWRAGIQQYLCFLPLGAAIAYLLRFAHFHPQPLVWWKFLFFGAGTFLGMLWVVALAEEFFFRAFLQQLLARRLRSGTAALISAAVLFGLAHLWFRAFPNWRFAILASVAGVFYGLAFVQGRSVRASMVTHALVNTTWKLFFTS